MYRVYGLALASNLSFRPLPEWPARDSGTPDVVLRVKHGPPPGSAEPKMGWTPLFERRLSGCLTFGVYQSTAGVVFRYHGRLEFHVDAGAYEVTCFRHAGYGDDLARRLFLSLVMAFVLSQRGCHNLHAAAVRIDAGAVAFLAPAGGGKSSLAAHFVRAGHALLTDDLLPVFFDGVAVRVLPGPPQLRLNDDSADRLWSDGDVPLRRGHVDRKRLVWLPQIDRFYCAEPLPLRAIYLLERSLALPARVERIGQRKALVSLVSSVYANFLSTGPKLSTQLSALAALVSAVPCRVLRLASGFNELPSARAAVAGDLAGTGSVGYG